MSVQPENDPYAGWARTLLDRFFGPHMAGQRARLVVTRKLLDEDYPHLGGCTGFLNAVLRGPAFLGAPKLGAENFHFHALYLYRCWRRKHEKRPVGCFSLPDDAPLYLPHLAALCLGWTINPDDEELATYAYYDRLELIMPNHGMGPPELSKWRKLWDELARWTENLDGKRGVFNVEILGQFRHVGIPLSQVLLTPTKVSNLCDLFLATGLAENWADADVPFVRNVLVAYESLSRASLGGMLYREIQNEHSAIGSATIERLLEFLADPAFCEGPGGPNPEPKPGGQNDKRTSLRVRLVLEAVDHPAGWRCRLGLLGADPPNPPRGGTGWRFYKVDDRLGGLWLATNEHSGGGPIDAREWSHALGKGLLIECQPAPGYDEESTILKIPARSVRVFHEAGWIGQRLVEEDAFPASGGCFLLVTSGLTGEIDGWIKRFKDSGGVVSNYTLEGLPLGCELLHLSGMERIDEPLANSFPERRLARTQSRSCIYLRGGSQVQGSGNQQLYLPYDPPDVILVAPTHVMLECSGATIIDDVTAGTSWKIPDGMPGLQPRQFRLEIIPDSSQVRVSAVSNDKTWIPEVVIFGVGREATLGANFAEDAHLRFNPLGIRTAGDGILGGLLDESVRYVCNTGDLWKFQERELALGEAAMTQHADHPGWCLLESLAQNRRVTSQEFRRRCERILKWWPRYGWSEARWIRALCHVEVERDNRGRIAYVYPVPPHAYLLPWRDNGRWLAVLGGCPARAALRRLLEVAGQLDVEVFCLERRSPLLAPRWLCRAKDLIAIELALEEAGLRLATEAGNPMPACASIGGWAASLDQWESNLSWLDGPPPAKERIFNPRHFKMATDESFACPYKLISITDSLSQKHQWHMLHYNGGWTGEPSHAFLLDPCWGKWLSMSKIAPEFRGVDEDDEEPRTPLPFELAGCSLHVPASLVFPTMLSRALLTSSGLPPVTMANGSLHYRQATSIFMPSEKPPYEGACHCYRDVHPELARLVCTKVRAKAIDV